MRKSWDGYIKDLMLSAKKITSPAIVSTTGSSSNAAAIADIEPTLNVENHASMETVMREILKKMRVRTAVWQNGDDGNTWQIVFSIEAGFPQERMLTMLTEWGIGERDGSVVSMMPCTVMAPPIRGAAAVPLVDRCGAANADGDETADGDDQEYVRYLATVCCLCMLSFGLVSVVCFAGRTKRRSVLGTDL